MNITSCRNCKNPIPEHDHLASARGEGEQCSTCRSEDVAEYADHERYSSPLPDDSGWFDDGGD